MPDPYANGEVPEDILRNRMQKLQKDIPTLEQFALHRQINDPQGARIERIEEKLDAVLELLNATKSSVIITGSDVERIMESLQKKG